MVPFNIKNYGTIKTHICTLCPPIDRIVMPLAIHTHHYILLPPAMVELH
jgi:hypothetical protein